MYAVRTSVCSCKTSIDTEYTRTRRQNIKHQARTHSHYIFFSGCMNFQYGLVFRFLLFSASLRHSFLFLCMSVCVHVRLSVGFGPIVAETDVVFCAIFCTSLLSPSPLAGFQKAEKKIQSMPKVAMNLLSVQCEMC